MIIDSVAECPLQKLDNGHKKSANSNTIFTVTQIIQLSCKETITSDGHVKLTIGNNIMNQVLGSHVPKWIWLTWTQVKVEKRVQEEVQTET